MLTFTAKAVDRTSLVGATDFHVINVESALGGVGFITGYLLMFEDSSMCLQIFHASST